MNKRQSNKLSNKIRIHGLVVIGCGVATIAGAAVAITYGVDFLSNIADGGELLASGIKSVGGLCVANIGYVVGNDAFKRQTNAIEQFKKMRATRRDKEISGLSNNTHNQKKEMPVVLFDDKKQKTYLQYPDDTKKYFDPNEQKQRD